MCSGGRGVPVCIMPKRTARDQVGVVACLLMCICPSVGIIIMIIIPVIIVHLKCCINYYVILVMWQQ